MTGSLTALADWIEGQLGDELASRQAIAETALARLREHLHSLDIYDALGVSPAATAVALDGSAVLAPADLLQVLGALSHAAAFLDERAARWCEDCARHPAGACESHVDDLDQAAAYRAVAVRLGDDR